MSTITTIQSTDAISASRSTINTNFANLNTDKAELSGATFTGDINVPDEAYGAGWNGSTEVPTKNAIYDKIETMGGGGVTDHGALTGLADDDHTQYTRADGTRSFTGKVSYSSHPTFSADTELVDKKYVDDSITAGGGYTDEQAQDAVGTILVDSARIDFTYNDATPSITADIIDDSVTFAKIQNISTNRILGRSTAGTGDIEELNVTAIPALIGLGTSDSPQFAGLNIGHATDTTLTRVSAGVMAIEGNTIVTTNRTASDTQTGIVELATIAETNTGTDATRAVTPDGLAGSEFGKRTVGVLLSGSATGDTALATGDGLAAFPVDTTLNGMNLVSIKAYCTTVSSSGAPLFQVRRSRRSSATVRTVVDMLTTGVSIDANEFESADATAAAVINTANDDVVTGDILLFDCDTAGTGTKGVQIILTFQLP